MALQDLRVYECVCVCAISALFDRWIEVVSCVLPFLFRSFQVSPFLSGVDIIQSYLTVNSGEYSHHRQFIWTLTLFSLRPFSFITSDWLRMLAVTCTIQWLLHHLSSQVHHFYCPSRVHILNSPLHQVLLLQHCQLLPNLSMDLPDILIIITTIIRKLLHRHLPLQLALQMHRHLQPTLSFRLKAGCSKQTLNLSPLSNVLQDS